MTSPSTTHAIVLGASMAGLLTARVLSEYVDQVTIVERDPVHSHPESRKGQPQTRHLHGLLANGLQLLRHVAMVHRATQVDPEVGRAFIKVMNLLAPPTSLMAPHILIRVLRAQRRRGARGVGKPAMVRT